MPSRRPPPACAGIDAALARRLVAAQFPRWADLPITLAEPGGRRMDSTSRWRPQADGLMFWLTRNRFCGSYLSFSATRRAYFSSP